MSDFKPTAIVSQQYAWEADLNVLEVLVFMDTGIDYELENPEKKATFKLRAVRQGDDTYRSIIRNGGEKPFLIHEFPINFESQFLAMHYLLDWLAQCFEVQHHGFKNVPNKKKE